MSITIISNFIIRNCRICLSYINNEEFVKISEDICRLYEFCCDHTLTTQKHHVLCNSCSDELKSFSEFKKKCLTAKQFWCKITVGEMESSNTLLENLEEETTKSFSLYSNNDIPSTIVSKVNDEYKTAISQRDVGDNDICKDTAFLPNENKLNEKTTLCCKECKKEFRSQFALVKHKTKCPKNVKKNIYNIEEIKECGLCSISVSGIEEVSSHLIKHFSENDLRCGLCKYEGTDFGDLLVHRFHHTASKQPVCVCSNQYRTPAYLLYHFRKAHLGQSGVYCARCRKDCGSLPAWRAHYASAHADKMECDYCGKRFTKSILAEHIRNVHLKITTCVCEICGASFKKKSNLKLHEQSHVRAPAPCAQCGRVLKNAAALRAHQRRRHAPAPAPHACPHCDKTFRRPSELRYHGLVHSDERRFACDICPATFKQKTSMYLHVRMVHNKEVTHPCGECDKGFNNARSLKRHRAVHTGVRPHACPHCPRTFHAPVQVRQHVLRRHPDSVTRDCEETVTTTTETNADLVSEVPGEPVYGEGTEFSQPTETSPLTDISQLTVINQRTVPDEVTDASLVIDSSQLRDSSYDQPTEVNQFNEPCLMTEVSQLTVINQRTVPDEVTETSLVIDSSQLRDSSYDQPSEVNLFNEPSLMTEVSQLTVINQRTVPDEVTESSLVIDSSQLRDSSYDQPSEVNLFNEPSLMTEVSQLTVINQRNVPDEVTETSLVIDSSQLRDSSYDQPSEVNLFNEPSLMTEVSQLTVINQRTVPDEVTETSLVIDSSQLRDSSYDQPSEVNLFNEPSLMTEVSQLTMINQRTVPDEVTETSLVIDSSQLRDSSYNQPTEVNQFNEPSLMREPSQLTKPSLMRQPSQLTKPSLMREPRQLTKPSLMREASQLTKPSLMTEPRELTKSSPVTKPSVHRLKVPTRLRSHECPDCLVTFHAPVLLKQHILKLHPIAIEVESSDCEPSDTTSVPIGELFVEPPSEATALSQLNAFQFPGPSLMRGSTLVPELRRLAKPSQLTEPVEFQSRSTLRQYAKKKKYNEQVNKKSICRKLQNIRADFR